MSVKFDLMADIEPFIALSKSTPVATALSLLRKPSVNFIVVVEDGNPQAVLDEGLLSNPLDQQRDTLADVLNGLPASIVRIAEGPIDENILKAIESVLVRTKLPGLLLFGKDGAGIVARRTLSLMLTPYPAGETSFRMYICRKCEPPSYSSPLEGDKAPDCPRSPVFHGPMELDT